MDYDDDEEVDEATKDRISEKEQVIGKSIEFESGQELSLILQRDNNMANGIDYSSGVIACVGGRKGGIVGVGAVDISRTAVIWIKKILPKQKRDL